MKLHEWKFGMTSHPGVTQDRVQLDLTTNESKNGLKSGSIDWIILGIEIENEQ